MANHLHDVCYLISGNDTPPLALVGNLCRHLILLRLEKGSLVKANRRGMDAHVGENNTWSIDTLRKSQMTRKRERCAENNVIECAVSLPKVATEIAIIILGRHPVEVVEIAAK